MIKRKDVSDYNIVEMEKYDGGALFLFLTNVCQNKALTCYIVDRGILRGIVTPGDFARYKQRGGNSQPNIDGLMNKNYMRVYHSAGTDFVRAAFNILKSNESVKTIPVVDSENRLMYFLELERRELTSISDDYNYPDLCDEASRDTYSFNIFKSDKTYKRILEHVTEEQGREYLDFIYNRNPEIMKDIQEYMKNDLYGGAETVHYDGIGSIAPSTLRYVAVMADIEKRFGSLDGMSICEIGIGYGGQCRLLSSRYKLKSYTLIDLPQVLGLAKRYLNCYPLNTRLIFSTMNELEPEEKYDLFISNYAFSEIKYELQECYYHKTINNSKRGYILYNDISVYDFKRYTLEDYERRIPDLEILDEIMKTADKNRLLCWNR